MRTQNTSLLGITRVPLGFITTLLFAFLIASTASALEEGERFSDWTVGCDKLPNSDEKRCFIYQTVVSNKDDKPVLQMAVGYLPQDNKSAAIMTVPLGVILLPGMGIRVDGGELITVAYERCTPKGCIAVLPLDQKMIGRFKKGNKAQVLVHDGQQAVPLPISLKGFTKGFNSLKP